MDTKLPLDFKNKWVEGLRSGQYKQAVGELYQEASDSYCCLGVACIVAGHTKDELAHNLKVPCQLSYPRTPALLHAHYLKEPNSIVCRLIDMNDNGRKSFNEIADYIEQNSEAS